MPGLLDTLRTAEREGRRPRLLDTILAADKAPPPRGGLEERINQPLHTTLLDELRQRPAPIDPNSSKQDQLKARLAEIKYEREQARAERQREKDRGAAGRAELLSSGRSYPEAVIAAAEGAPGQYGPIEKIQQEDFEERDREAERMAAADASWMETARKAFQNIDDQIVGRGGGGLIESLPTTLRYLSAAAGLGPGAPMLPQSSVEKTVEDFGKGMFERASAEIERNSPELGNSPGKQFAYDAITSFSSLLTAVGVTAATRNPEAGAAVLGAQVFGDRFAQSIKEGRSREEALADGAIFGFAEMVGERAVLGSLLKPGQKLASRVVKGALGEALQESVTSVIQNGYAKGILYPEMTMGEALNAIAYDATLGAASGGTAAVVAHPFRRKELKLGIIEQAEAGVSLTLEDQASPIPTDLIRQGKATVAGAEASRGASEILGREGIPGPGKRVVIQRGDRRQEGVIEDAFTVSDSAGVRIRLDDGSVFEEFFDTIRDTGTAIKPVDEVVAEEPLSEPVVAVPERRREEPRPTGDTLSRMIPITLGAEGGGTLAHPKVSPKGARGPMQVMPGTEADPGYGVRSMQNNSEAERARVGRDYLAAMMREYGNDPAKAWAAYNAGPGALNEAIRKHGDNWLTHMPAETQAYVRKNVARLGEDGSVEAVPPRPAEEVETPRRDDDTFLEEPVARAGFAAAEQAPRLADLLAREAEQATQPEAEDVPAAVEPERPTIRTKGKSVIVANITEPQRTAIDEALPGKTRLLPRSDGSFSVPAKYEPTVRAVVEEQAPIKVAPSPLDRIVRMGPETTALVEEKGRELGFERQPGETIPRYAARIEGRDFGEFMADLAGESGSTPSKELATTPASVRIGNREYPFTSFEEVSKAYRSTIDKLDIGGSQTPQASLLDANGNQVGYISHNGKVWAGTQRDSQPGQEPIYTPFDEEGYYKDGSGVQRPAQISAPERATAALSSETEAGGAGQPSATVAPEASAEAAPRVATFEEFAAENGASRQGFGDAGLHSPAGNIGRNNRQQTLNRVAAENAALSARRDELRVEYDAAVERGDIRPPTSEESLRATAAGDPDNESTQAAARVLAKREERRLAAEFNPTPYVEPLKKLIAETTIPLNRADQFASQLGISEEQVRATMGALASRPDSGIRMTKGSPAKVRRQMIKSEAFRPSKKDAKKQIRVPPRYRETVVRPAIPPRLVRVARRKSAETLMERVRRAGGVRSDAHDLRNVGALARYPGVISSKGRSVDDLGELLTEEGWFTERPTEAEVIELLDQGSTRRTVHPGEQDVGEIDLRAEEARADVEAVITETGYEFTDEETDDAARYVLAGDSPEIAVQRASDDAAARSLYEGADDTGNEDYRTLAETIYEGREAEQRDSGASEAVAGSEGDERDTSGRSPPGAQPDEGGGDANLETRAGAALTGDGRPAATSAASPQSQEQLDAFGIQAGDERRALERKGEGRLKSEATQKPPGSEGGLFDNNATQADIENPIAQAKAALQQAMDALDGAEAASAGRVAESTTKVEDAADFVVETGVTDDDDMFRTPYETTTPEGAIQSGDFGEAVEWVRVNSKSEANQALAERLAPLVEGIRLRVYNREDARLGRVPRRMMNVHGSVLHNAGQARAFLNSDTRGLTEEIILHEATHAAVAVRAGALRNVPLGRVDNLEGFGEDARRLYALAGHAQAAYLKRFNQDRLKGVSFTTRAELRLAFENIDEFLTYGLTNPEFQAFLDSVEMPDIVAETKRPTLWQAFVNLLRKMVGLPAKYQAEFAKILDAGSLNEQFFDTAEGLLARLERTRPVAQDEAAGDAVEAGAPGLYAEAATVSEFERTAEAIAMTGGAGGGGRNVGSTSTAPAFNDPDSEARWQDAAKGLGDGPGLIERAKGWWEDVATGFTRHWRDLPNEPRFADLAQQFRKLESSPTAAKERTVRLLRDLVGKMDKAQLDLFTRKVVLDDLTWEADAERQLPFGFTAETLAVEKAKIDRLVDQDPAIVAAVRKRKLVNREIANEMVAAGVLSREQIRNAAYFRHMVLDYARAEMRLAKGTGQKIKSPYWAKRMGSSLDINAHLLEAEFEWLQKAQVDIATARTIDWVKNSEHNIRDELRAKAKALNAEALETILAENEEAAAQAKDFRKTIGVGMKKVADAVKNDELGIIPDHLQEAAAKLLTDNDDLFALLAWILDNDKPGAIGAAMILKASGQRKSWERQLLGGKYIDPNDTPSLVKKLAPDAYAAWQPIEGRHLFTAKTVPEHILEGFVERLSAPNVAGIPADEMHRALTAVRSQLVVGGERYTMVLPKEVADTLTEFGDRRAEGLFSQGVQLLQGAWKRWVLINPRRFLKYNLNNVSGDLDALIAGNPRALLKVKAAAKELYAVMRKGEKPSARYEEAVERGVFDSGLSIQEIPDISRLSAFRHLTDDHGSTRPDKLLFQAAGNVWRALQGTTQWRENVFRYASYLDYIEKIEAGRPTGYGASVPKMVDAVKDPKDKAALLARDLIGDYGSISVAGGWLRRHLIPFWSWTEINTKRYWRLTSNAWSQGAGKGIATGGALAITSGARISAALYIRMALFYGLVTLWNNFLFGDEEDDLGEQQQRQMHIILGKYGGEIVTLRIQGALSDVFGLMGLPDAAAAFKKYLDGQGSIGATIGEMAKAPVNKVATGLNPFIGVPLEQAMGKELWPDIFSPRDIKDRWRHVFSTLSLENEYDFAFAKPSRGYVRSWQESILYRRDPGEMAYDEAKGIAYDWLAREKGEGSTGSRTSPRSTALRDYRQALRFGDERAAEKALRQYESFGGTGEGFKASIKRQHPLGPIAKKDRQAFLNSLTDEQYETFALAEQWYDETFLEPTP